ncbi:hypothetical protein AAG906_022892 [Vitis piasezkii]
MGWEIVREKYPRDPNKWSRLMKEIQFNSQVWAEMMKLRLLQIICNDDEEFMKMESKVHFPEDFEFSSYELSYLLWERYPFESLPSNFYGENLIEINLKKSNIRQLWQGNKRLNLRFCGSLDKIDSSIGVLTKLTWLDLSNCKQLKSLPSSIQYLDSLKNFIYRLYERFKELWLDNTAIEELSSSIGHITSLELLSLRICKNLKSLPSNICRLESLTTLDLRDYSNLETFPEITEDMQHLESLNLRGTDISGNHGGHARVERPRFTWNGYKELPSSVQRIKRLRSLDLKNCKDLETLPHTIYDLEFLEDLIAHGCPKLKKFPRNLGNLKGLRSLEKLDLSYCDGMEGAIFSDIGQFYKLRELNISHCKLLQEIPEFPSTLREIDAHDCTALETLFSPSSPLWSSFLKWLKSATQDSECDTQTGISKINIPGSSGIPRWVSYQKMGNQIRIRLPMNLYEDNNFFGFAFLYLYQKVNGSEKHFEDDFPLLYSWKLLGGSSLEISFDSHQATCVNIKGVGIHLVYIQDHQQNHAALDLLDAQGNLDVQYPTSQDDEHNHIPMPLDLLRNFEQKLTTTSSSSCCLQTPSNYSLGSYLLRFSILAWGTLLHYTGYNPFCGLLLPCRDFPVTTSHSFASLNGYVGLHEKLVYLEFKVVNIYTIKSGALQIVLQLAPWMWAHHRTRELFFSLIIRAVSGFK